MSTDLQVHDVAIELVRAMRPIVEAVRNHDAALARQLRGATTSVPSNIAEGSRRRGRDKHHHYRIAAGSAEEVRSPLAIAVAWGDIHERMAQPALELLDRILAMLWRLTETSDRDGAGRGRGM